MCAKLEKPKFDSLALFRHNSVPCKASELIFSAICHPYLHPDDDHTSKLGVGIFLETTTATEKGTFSVAVGGKATYKGPTGNEVSVSHCQKLKRKANSEWKCWQTTYRAEFTKAREHRRVSHYLSIKNTTTI